MKFYIISRSDQLSNKLMATAKNYLEDFGMEWNEESPDVVLSIGGDGTLLHGFHKYSEKLADVAFVGIHTGHLGFYADWKPSEIEKLVLSIAKKDYEVIEYPLLEVSIHYQNLDEPAVYLALNESTVKSVIITWY